jgi:hypothetical protein
MSTPRIATKQRRAVAPDEYDWIAHENLTKRIHHMAVVMGYALGDKVQRDRVGEMPDVLADSLRGLAYEIENACDEIMALREAPMKKGGA